MPRLLTEEEAARVDFYKDQMSEADKARAVEKLDAYHADRRAKEAERTFQAFSNPTTVDAWDTTGYLKDSPGTYLDGEQDQWRKRMANTQFLASEYGHPLDVVTREYDRYAFDYAAKNFGDTTALEPAQLFERIKPVVEGKRTAAKTGYEAAIKGGSKFVAMREFQRANPGLPAQAMQTFERTYDEVAGAIKPWRPLMAEALAAGHALEVGNGGEAERAKVTSLIDTLADMPERERGHVLVALHQQATAVGKHSERGITGTFTGSAVRVIEDMFGGNAERLPGGLQRQLKSGQTSRSEPIRNEVDALAAIDADMQDRRHGSIRARHNEELPLRQMTPEEQAVMNKVFDRERKREHVVRQWAQVARKTDPFNDSVLGKMAAGAGSSVALIAPLTMGPQGVFAAGMGYAQTDYDKMMLEHPDMDKGAAADTAAWSGAIQAGLDKLELFGLGKLAPNVANIIMGKGTRELVKSTALQVGATFFFENVQEGLQDLTLPTVQSLASALSRDVPSVDWDGEMENFWGSRLDVAVGVLPLTLLGIGVNTVSNRESVLKIMADNVALGSLGIAEEERVKIQTLVQSGNAEGAQAALQAAWSGRDPALAAEFQERYQQAAPARQAVRETLRREAASLGVSITRGGDGQWFVNRADGTSVAVDSAERAALLQGDLMQAAHEAEAEAFNTVLDSPLFANADKVTIQGSSLELKDGELVRTTHAETEVKIIKDAAMLAAVRAQMAGLGLTKDVEINGSNTVFAETVGAAAKLLIEINKSTQQPLTITGVHESVEGNYKRGLLSGAFTEADVMNALSRVAAAIDLSALERRAMRARAGASKQDATAALTLRQRLDKVVAGEATSDELRETMVELAVMDILERDANGRKTGWQAGTLRRIIDAEMERATDGQTLSSLGKLRAWINAARSWFAGVFGTVRAIQKAKESGKLKEGDEFSSFVDKLLNLEESQFAKAVEGEAVAMTSHSLSLAKWSKADTLKHGYSNEFLDSKDWQGLRDAIAVIDPRAGGENGGLTSQATGPETVSAELSKLYQAGFIAEPLKRIDKVGGEHNVEFRGDRVYKQTFPETFGAKFDAKKPEVLVHASPLEYLKRWRAFSEIFPAVRFEGVVRHSDGTASLQISQPLLSGPKPTLEALESQLKEDEWKKAAIGTWTKTTSRGLLRITDVKPDNFAVVDDVILPLDVITSLEDSSGTSFSLSPARRLDLVTNRVAMLIDQRHLGAQKFAQNATSNLQRVRSRWADMPAPKTKAELDRSQAELVNTRRAELEEKLVGEIEFRMGGVHDLVTKLREHPLGDALLRSDMRRKRLYLGGLMAPAKWRAEQLARGESIPGDYDGAEGLPAMFFKGNQTPDDVAKELHGLGIIKGDSADDLWSAMHSMLDELATNKEQMASYKEQLREAAQSAKEEAEYEGRAWRAERDAEQARLGTPREAAIRDLAVVEAVAVALPAEVRAKMPTGWASIAGLKTDKEFANAIAERVKMIDRALTAHWKAKNLEEMNSLVLLGQGKTSPGKKPRGTATPEVHEYFGYVAQVVGMTPAELLGARANIDAARAAAAGTAEEIKFIQQGQILDTWGGFEKLHVAAQSQVLEDGWDIYTAGRNDWRAKEDKRLEAQRLEAQELLTTIKQGTYERITDAKGRGMKAKDKLEKFAVETRDFEGTLAALLGREHPITKRWAKAVRDGLARKDDSLRALRQRWQSALDVAMPGMSRTKQRKRIWEMRTARILEVDILEDVARADLTAEQRDELRAADMLGQVQSKVKLTEDEALFITMTARQAQYLEGLALAGFTPAVLQSLEARLSPEAKALREFMAAEYDAGHAGLDDVMRRVNGIKLPKIKNYSPGRFYNWGNEKPLDVMGTGIVSGGFASGFLVDRKIHAAEVKLASALGVFWTHQNESLHWQSLAEPVRDMRGVLRNPQVKRALDAAWGENFANSLFEQWMQAIEGNGIRQAAGAWDRLISKASSNFAVARLGYNIGTIAKQSMAVLNTALDVPFGMWAMGAGEVWKNPARFREVFDSDFIQRRLESGFSPEVRDLLDSFWNSKPGEVQNFMERGMEFIGWADAFFTSVSAAVAYEAHARMAERAGMSPDQAHIIGMEKAAEAVARTSQPTTVATRSLFELRMSPVAKLSFMFMTEARQKAALWAEAVGNLATGKATARDKQILLVSHLLMAPMLQTITSILKDWRDGPNDGDDDPAWEVTDFLVASILGPIDGLPFVGAAIKDGIAGRKFGGKGSDVLGSPVTAALTVAGDLLTDLFDDKDQTAAEEFNKILRFARDIGGAPGVGANIFMQGKDTVESFQ